MPTTAIRTDITIEIAKLAIPKLRHLGVINPEMRSRVDLMVRALEAIMADEPLRPEILNGLDDFIDYIFFRWM